MEKKTFKQWVEGKEVKSSLGADGKKVEYVKPVGKLKKPNNNTKKTAEIFEEPIWRRKTVSGESDKTPKTPAIVIVTLMSLIVILCFLIVYLYILSVLPSEKVNRTTINSKNFSIIDEQVSVSTKKNLDYYYYMVQIAATGTRQLQDGEITNVCGDILVPIEQVEKDVDLTGTTSEIEKIDFALTALFSFKKATFDVTRNLTTSLSLLSLSVKEIKKVGNDYVVNIAGTIDAENECEAERIYGQILNTVKKNITGTDSKIEFQLDSSKEKFNVFLEKTKSGE